MQETTKNAQSILKTSNARKNIYEMIVLQKMPTKFFQAFI